MPVLPPRQSETMVLAVICLAVFMADLDSSIVNISLPTIADAFHVDLGVVSWVVMAYLLVVTGLMLAFGRLGDMLGLCRVFTGGLILFTAGSFFCALSGSIGVLIASRVVQGIGGAAILAIAPALLAASLPAERRGRALGIMMTVVSFAIAAGPILGGFLTEYAGWPWIFIINVPVGIAAAILSFRIAGGDPVPHQAGQFDTAGAALILLALTTLLYPVSQGLYLGWTSPVVAGCLLVSLPAFVLFWVHERRCRNPLVDLRLFSSPAYLRGNIAGMLILLAFAGAIFLLPFYFELVRLTPTDIVGLFLGIPAVALIVCGPVAGRWSDRYGSRGLMAGSAALSAAAMYLCSRLDASSDIFFLVTVLVLLGVGIGLFVPPNMRLILGSGGAESGGVASAVMMTIRTAGALFGVAVSGTIAVQAVAGPAAGPALAASSGQILPGIQAAFLLGAVICLAGVLISLATPEPAPAPASA
ncbi:MAG: MFS transporter [Methanomicrobiales archaeon HGW-Methanomicrobiales-3]|nr:MAG: MFS transporter [Methanomicrobiales archaeon HGW-Methanomicrobiales-3]